MGKKTGNPRGRPEGSANKQTLDVKELAQDYTAGAIETLAAIMQNDEEAAPARVAAARELLDRAHGKPKQAVDVAGSLAVTKITRKIVDPGT